MGNGTEKQIDRSTGDSIGAATIEETGRLIIIGRLDLQISKIAEGSSNALESFLFADSRQDLLADRADQDRFPRSHKPRPLQDQPLLMLIQGRRTATEGERPDRRIDKDNQSVSLRRSFL